MFARLDWKLETARDTELTAMSILGFLFSLSQKSRLRLRQAYHFRLVFLDCKLVSFSLFESAVMQQIFGNSVSQWSASCFSLDSQ